MNVLKLHVGGAQRRSTVLRDAAELDFGRREAATSSAMTSSSSK
jgi:hypothetical protein